MRKKNISCLPYRDNVSCVVFKNKKFLLVQLLLWPKDFWKFPQGGIEENESEEKTIKRELLEEMSIKKYKIVGLSFHKHKYDWDENSLKRTNYKWRGQKQKFYVIEYLGEDKEIQVNRKEVRDYKWVNKKEVLRSISHNYSLFKGYKNIIEKILEEFKTYF
ncbi:NUDIX domain-containing protein [Patescibacteria group bacterium]|nr:NUDIX domain-containing protein [Patescibacteria group bacterium]